MGISQNQTFNETNGVLPFAELAKIKRSTSDSRSLVREREESIIKMSRRPSRQSVKTSIIGSYRRSVTPITKNSSDGAGTTVISRFLSSNISSDSRTKKSSPCTRSCCENPFSSLTSITTIHSILAGISCGLTVKRKHSETELMRWLLRRDPQCVIAPDCYLPNSLVRNRIIQKDIRVMSTRKQTTQSSITDHIQQLMFTRLLEPEAGDNIVCDPEAVRARVEEIWRQDAKRFIRSVMQEERERLEQLVPPSEQEIATAIQGSDLLKAKTSSSSAMIQPRRTRPKTGEQRREMIFRYLKKQHFSEPRTGQEVLNLDLQTVEETNEKPVEVMSDIEFGDFLSILLTKLGSIDQVYQLISQAIARENTALTELNTLLGSRNVRNAFYQKLRMPKNAFTYLASLLGSSRQLREVLARAIDGNVADFELLSPKLDSATAVYNLIEAYKEARREAIQIIQSFMPLCSTCGSIVDMLIDGNESKETVAELINGVDVKYDTRLMQLPRITVETLSMIAESVLNCDGKRLREMKRTKIPARRSSAMVPTYQDADRKFGRRASSQEGFIQNASELRFKMSVNTLVKDTLNELRVNPQNTLLEPTTMDYVNLVNKGEFFMAQISAPDQEPSHVADERLIEHFSTLMRKMRHVMAWSMIKDPVEGDLCLSNLKRTIARGISVTEAAVRYIEEFMAGAAKSRNVADMVQRAVYGNPDVTQELTALLGSGKNSYLLTTVQEAQGQVVDRLLRHCATDCEIQAIEKLLKTIESKSENEIQRRLYGSWIRVIQNISKLAVKFAVKKSAQKTRDLLVSKEMTKAVRRFDESQRLLKETVQTHDGRVEALTSTYPAEEKISKKPRTADTPLDVKKDSMKGKGKMRRKSGAPDEESTSEPSESSEESLEDIAEELHYVRDEERSSTESKTISQISADNLRFRKTKTGWNTLHMLGKFSEFPEETLIQAKRKRPDDKEEVDKGRSSVTRIGIGKKESIMLHTKSKMIPITPRPTPRSRKRLLFMRRGSTLLKETVSSMARRFSRMSPEERLDAMRSKTSDTDKEPSVESETSSSILSSLNIDLAAKPSTEDSQKASDEQEATDENELSEPFQETMLLDEQTLRMHMFNAFLPENIHKLLRTAEDAPTPVEFDAKASADERPSFWERLVNQLLPLTEGLPKDVTKNMAKAVDSVIDDIRNRKAATQPERASELTPKTEPLAPEMMNSLADAVHTIFSHRLEDCLKSAKVERETKQLDAKEIKKSGKQLILKVQEVGMLVKKELVNDPDTPAVVRSAVCCQLDDLCKKAQVDVKEDTKRAIREQKYQQRRSQQAPSVATVVRPSGARESILAPRSRVQSLKKLHIRKHDSPAKGIRLSDQTSFVEQPVGAFESDSLSLEPELSKQDLEVDFTMESLKGFVDFREDDIDIVRMVFTIMNGTESKSSGSLAKHLRDKYIQVVSQTNGLKAKSEKPSRASGTWHFPAGTSEIRQPSPRTSISASLQLSPIKGTDSSSSGPGSTDILLQSQDTLLALHPQKEQSEVSQSKHFEQSSRALSQERKLSIKSEERFSRSLKSSTKSISSIKSADTQPSSGESVSLPNVINEHPETEQRDSGPLSTQSLPGEVRREATLETPVDENIGIVNRYVSEQSLKSGTASREDELRLVTSEVPNISVQYRSSGETLSTGHRDTKERVQWSRESGRRPSVFVDDADSRKMSILLQAIQSRIKSEIGTSFDGQRFYERIRQSLSRIAAKLEHFNLPKLVMMEKTRPSERFSMPLEMKSSPITLDATLDQRAMDVTEKSTTTLSSSTKTTKLMVPLKEAVVLGAVVEVQSNLDRIPSRGFSKNRLQVFVNQEMGICIEGLEMQKAKSHSENIYQPTSTISQIDLTEPPIQEVKPIPHKQEVISDKAPLVDSKNLIFPTRGPLLVELPSSTTQETLSSGERHENFLDGLVWTKATHVRDVQHVVSRISSKLPSSEPSSIVQEIDLDSASREREEVEIGRQTETATIQPQVKLSRIRKTIKPAVPPGTRAVTRPSWIPCQDWARMIGPHTRTVWRRGETEEERVRFKRAEHSHMSSSTIQKRCDLFHVLREAAVRQKSQSFLPPIHGN